MKRVEASKSWFFRTKTAQGLSVQLAAKLVILLVSQLVAQEATQLAIPFSNSVAGL